MSRIGFMGDPDESPEYIGDTMGSVYAVPFAIGEDMRHETPIKRVKSFMVQLGAESHEVTQALQEGWELYSVETSTNKAGVGDSAWSVTFVIYTLVQRG